MYSPFLTMDEEPLFDSHCHIDMVLEKGISEKSIQESLKKNSVKGFIQIAGDPKSIVFSSKYAKEDHNFKVYYTIGQHPNEVTQEDIYFGIEFALRNQDDPKFVAIGEIGLDYYYSPENMEKQKEAFKKYIDLALEIKRPICIHTRDAHKDTIRFIQEIKNKVPVLIHCFTGNRKQMEDFLSLECFISFSGIVTFKNALELQEAAKYCPEEKMLVETDAPFLTPVPFRGKPNQPGLVRHTLNFLADLKKLDPSYLSKKTYENTMKFYRLSESLSS